MNDGPGSTADGIGAHGLDAHRSTLDVYEGRAPEWHARRTAHDLAATEFTDAVVSSGIDGPVIDLGCGPGWHLPNLPDGAVALDATRSMLDLVPGHAPDAPRVQADLRGLPFARGSMGGAWADRSYVHLRRDSVPLALWDLHRALRVGSIVRLVVFSGDDEHATHDSDDFPGRWFSHWPEQLLRDVVEGAGFSIDRLLVDPRGSSGHLEVWARRERTLADTVGPGMRLLLVGLNPSLVAADAGVGFHRNGNRAWPALRAAGLASVDRDPLQLLAVDRIGMTDLVKRASPRANELTRDEFGHGRERLDRLCTWLRPGAVCVLGLTGWRAAVDRAATVGVQEATLGGRPVYLMPNPSGVNAHVTLDDVADHLRAAAQLADQSPQLVEE